MSETSKPSGRRPRRSPVHPLLRPVQDGGIDRHASWLELFFDLTFVIVLSQVAYVLNSNLSWIGFLHFVALTVPFWWAWIGYTFYASRFEVEQDLVYRVLMLFGMLAVTALAVSIRGAFNGGGTAFVLAYVAVRLVLIVLYIRAWIYVHLARELCTWYLVGFSAGALLWLASLVAPEPFDVILRAAGLGLELTTPLFSSRVARRTPYDPMHIPERFGLFTIIALGEALLGMVNGIADTRWSVTSFLVAMFCFGISVSFWWIYFDFVETRPVRRWGRAGQVYTYIHLPLVMAIAMVGVGTRRAIVESTGTMMSDPVRWVICGGVALYLFTVIVIRIASRSGAPIAVRLGSAVVALGLAFLGGGLSSLPIVLVLFGTMVLDICIETIYTWNESAREMISPLAVATSGAPPPHGDTPAEGRRTHLSDECTHRDQIRAVTPSSDGCEECRKLGDTWVELRLCLVCGYVGCCETSKNRHSLAHFRRTAHPIIQTMQPGQRWRWCYIDEVYLEEDRA